MKISPVLSTLLFVATIQSAFATVGGPTIIYDFTYNPANESVYYIKQDFGGRGCPPELLALSLNTEKVTTVFSCSEGEVMSQEQVAATITTTTNGFKTLTPLNLKSNAIMIDLRFIKTETYGSESDEVMRRHFLATVYQSGRKVVEFAITGCTIDQPFTFQGYSIPGFNKKILLLSSAKGNCAEGGYINESLHVIGGVDNLDKTATGNFYKGVTPLLPNEGNLVVYEADSLKFTAVTTADSSTTPPVTETSTKESLFRRFVNWIVNLFR